MARVLAVGIATLDIVNEVECYPPEDGEVRALAQTQRRGGNATNTLVVLSQLGHSCEWAGNVVEEPNAGIIFDELRRYGIGTRYCRKLAYGTLPTSYVTVSRATASRTIVHYRDLPEFDSGSFCAIPLQEFDWLHFEGRNIAQTARMMQGAREQVPNLRVSLEVEKPREGMETLFRHADLILFSLAISRHYRCTPEALLREVHAESPTADLVCTLGENGAVALGRNGEWLRSDAFVPRCLVDTLGAGDTFNAAMIDSMLRGVPLADALRFSCQLAGNKCAQSGLHDLRIPGVSSGYE